MKTIFVLVLTIFTVLCNAQENDKGVRFIKGLSWEAIQTMARAENKFVFVDVNASWCQPCKAMEKDVFSKDTIGMLLNDKFISIKVQMDTSSNDDEETMIFYQDAKRIKDIYMPNAYPTFYFFSSKGALVHQGVGYQNIKRFAMLVTNSLDPNKQYFSLSRRYRSGERDQKTISYLLLAAQEAGFGDSASLIANEIIRHLGRHERLDSTNLQTIFQYTKSSSDPGFSILYHNAKKADAVFKIKGKIEFRIANILAFEYYNPEVKLAERESRDPDWNKLAETIRKKYNNLYAERVVEQGQLIWFKAKKRWDRYLPVLVKTALRDMDNLPPMYLNNEAMNVFRYSTSTDQLHAALTWVKERVLDEKDADYIDTYASLLYKMGQVKEAIEWEQKAVDLDPKNAGIQEIFDKMKKGLPTWPTK